ncbi:hypothetical protein G7Y89_g7149 [Cudoniella acicularis]|uniref:Arrestin-like N-terminal domain-containing protein n=1 Tax=Cudoniella acicularis TaxID=354080 RepID=A0A8H4RJW8_9HELO|nr:hypothetical protein G7Y89_g7149 [Cudoniella acicularis]
MTPRGYSASLNSTAGTIATYAKKMGLQGRPNLDISLDDHTDGKVYTSFDALSGKVNITAPHSARFDEIQITLEGTVRTYVENLSPTSTTSRTTAIHRFLKLTMPIAESDYPQPRIAEAGRTYTYPFNFVIPDQLLPRSCSHECASDHVHEAHLQLPPSMGDRELSAFDDLAPEMSKVQYAIRVKIIRHRESDGKEVVLVEGQRKLHIVPAITEAPPLNVSAEEDEYVLSKTKTLRKGMFSGKLGKITASAEQPRAFVLPSPSSTDPTPATSMATVHLRFDPRDSSSQPPRLGGLNTKIKASTFYGARPTAPIPTHRNALSQFETQRGVYDLSVSLSSRSVESVSWTVHRPSPAYTRRDSASSSSSSDCSDSDHTTESIDGAVYYTASILVPVTLPSNKTWVPTFHNCITSRVYSLDLSLTIHTPGTGVPASTVTLHLPIQIAATGNQSQRPAMTAAEATAELAEVDEYFRPRVIEVPSENLIGNSVLPHHSELPPSYEDFSPAQPQQTVDPSRC